MPRKKKESKKAFVAGFAITVIALLGLSFGLFYFTPGVPVNHLPPQVPQYSAVWGRYIPQDALLFGFENYTAIRQYNASYPTQFSTLLNIVDLKVSLKAVAIESALTVSFASPNESIAFAFVNRAAFENFTSAFSSASYSAVPSGNATMYYVRNYLNGQFQFGWIALIPADRGIAFAVGNADAKLALQKCLELRASDAVITKLDVRQMLYIANGTSRHLAIGIQLFPGVIKDASNTMTLIDVEGSQVLVRRILEFNSTATALADYNGVRQSYLSSTLFNVYDSYVRATAYMPVSDVTRVIRLVE